MQEIAPAVHTMVSKRRRRTMVAAAMHNDAWINHVRGALTMQVIVELDWIYDLLEEVVLNDEPDTFKWNLTADGVYSAASAYAAMFFGCSQPPAAKYIWKMTAPPKVCFFFGLTLHRRCWTVDRLWRHGLQVSNAYITCDQAAETIDHILLSCCYAREVWHRCLSAAQLQAFVTIDGECALDWWLASHKRLPKALRPAFDSLFFLVGWSLWKERNNRTFNAIVSTPPELVQLIWTEGRSWCAAGFSKLRLLLDLFS